jgi:uncharacterized protein
LAPDQAIPEWALTACFASATRTVDETSIVCPAATVPQGVKAERDWICFRLEGPFAFSETGVLASLIDPLAERYVPIFAVSTYNTDYVFVQQEFADTALAALTGAGHELCQTLSGGRIR